MVSFNFGGTIEWEWQALFCSPAQMLRQEGEVGIAHSSYSKSYTCF